MRKLIIMSIGARSVVSLWLMLSLKGSSHVSTSSNPREIVVTAMEQANTISNVANSLLQPHIDEENILKAQVSFVCLYHLVEKCEDNKNFQLT